MLTALPAADITAFYSTAAGIIPVVLLALAFQFGSAGFRFIPEQMLRSDVDAGARTERDFWIAVYSLLMLTVLVVGEIVALFVVASGRPQPWWAAIVAASLVVGGAGLVIPIVIVHVGVINEQRNLPHRHSAARLAVRTLLAVGAAAGAASVVYAVATPSRIIVPNVIGARTVFFAEAQLSRVGLELSPIVRSVAVDPSHIGAVVAQVPAAGTSVEQRTSIQVTVGMSSSSNTVVVPRVTAMSVLTAESVLRNHGLALGAVRPANALPTARVTAQAPGAGQRVPPGSTVALFVGP